MTVQPILQKKFTVSETVVQGLHILLCNFLDILLLDPEMGLKWAYRRLRITQMADCDFLIILRAVHK